MPKKRAVKLVKCQMGRKAYINNGEPVKGTRSPCENTATREGIDFISMLKLPVCNEHDKWLYKYCVGWCSNRFRQQTASRSRRKTTKARRKHPRS